MSKSPDHYFYILNDDGEPEAVGPLNKRTNSMPRPPIVEIGGLIL